MSMPFAVHDPELRHSKYPLTTGGAALALATALWGWCQAVEMPLPVFVWFDVAVVQLLGAVPLAMLISSWSCARFRPGARAGACVGLLLLAGILMFGVRPPVASPATTFDMLTAALWRNLIATLTGLACASGASLLMSDSSRQAPIRDTRQSVWFVLLALVTTVLLPGVYTTSRCEYQTNRLQELLDLSRLEKARRLAQQIVSLNPAARLAEHSISQLSKRLERQVVALKNQVAVPLPIDATDEQLIERARQLAILDQSGRAINLLLPLVDRPEPLTEACVLLGTIFQATEDWTSALANYRQALVASTAWHPTQSAAALQIAATRGIGFCERKRGNYPAAEAAYLHLLELTPSADSHFLLARFYEDTQQATRASEYARRAIKLAPARYSAEGRRLIDGLIVRQFGCFAVQAAERDRAATPRFAH